MDTAFLVWTLLFPRLTLLFCYANGYIPSNAIPFWGDVVMAAFIPRVLVLIYIYEHLGVGSGWFWIHVVALILCYSGGSSAASSRKD